MKAITAILLFMIVAGFQQDPKKLIIWSETNKVEWPDFQGPPENIPSRKAMTSAGLQTNISALRDSLTFRSVCIFDKSKSWVRQDSKTPEILAHERLHFDITEVLCRKLKKSIKEQGTLSKKNFQQVISELTKKAYDSYNADQVKYDQESYVSMDKQKEWNVRIEAELKSLEAYKDPVIKMIITN